MRVYLLSLGKIKLNSTSLNLESSLIVKALLIRREEPLLNWMRFFMAHPPII
jgi:hypothetical protein